MANITIIYTQNYCWKDTSFVCLKKQIKKTKTNGVIFIKLLLTASLFTMEVSKLQNVSYTGVGQ